MRHEDLEAVRESLRWPPSLLKILLARNPKCLIQVSMLVKFYHEKGTNEVLNALVWHLSVESATRREGCFIYSEVSDWVAFCTCFCRALADVSRGSHPDEMRRKYIIDVVDYECHVSVWWDENAHCLYYRRA